MLLSCSIVQTLKKTFLCKFPWWPDRGGRGVAAYSTVQYSAVLYTGVQMINMAGAREALYWTPPPPVVSLALASTSYVDMS